MSMTDMTAPAQEFSRNNVETGAGLHVQQSNDSALAHMPPPANPANPMGHTGHSNHSLGPAVAAASTANNNSLVSKAPPNTSQQTPQQGEGSDPDALTRLLEHIESLKQSNAEMSATLENIQEKNMENYHIEVEEKIKPWVTSLNIPPEQKESFLKGIQIACEQGMKKKGIVDFKCNPAFSIACAAAQAHGALIENAEKFRIELLEANSRVETIKQEESNNYNNNRQRQHAILSSALTTDSRESQMDASGTKRKVSEIYNNNATSHDDAKQSNCWSTVFDNINPGGTRSNY